MAHDTATFLEKKAFFLIGSELKSKRDEYRASDMKIQRESLFYLVTSAEGSS